jgi:hypothetical protein
MTDVVTPDFRRRSALGEIIISPMSRTRTGTENHGSGQVAMVAGDGSGYLHVASNGMSISDYYAGGTYLYNVLPNPNYETVDPAIVALVKREALSRIDSTPVKLMEDLLEFRKSLSFIRHPLHEALKTTADLRSAVRKKSFSAATFAASEGWLKARFVYQNAYFSVRNALSVQTEDSKPIRRTARYTQDKSEIFNDSYSRPWGSGAAIFDVVTTKSVRISAGCIYEVTNPIDTFREKAGLRLKDLPAGLWAVSPYSWVVDRFVNVSSVINGLRALGDPGVVFKGGWVSTKTDCNQSVSLTGSSGWSGWSISITPDEHVRLSYQYDRIAWTPTINDAFMDFDLGNWKTEFQRSRQDIISSIDLTALLAVKMRSLSGALRKLG